MQIIGMNLINQKKYKKQSQHQIFNLEEQVKTFMKADLIQEKQDEFETNLKIYINAQVEKMMGEVTQCREDLRTQS